MPVLTVAMPVHNAMPYLPAAVESILRQTFADFAFVIADDGSDDGSQEYLKSLRDPRIDLHSEKRRGLQATRNFLLQLTKTDLCALMDADDVALPDRLQLQWDFMRRSPGIVLLGTQIGFIAGDRSFARGAFPTRHASIVRKLLESSPVICQPSCMFRTQEVRTARGYRLAYGEDIDLFLRLSELGTLANLPDRLHMYRIHLASSYPTAYTDHQANISYAITCYRRRQAGLAEPAMDDFIKAWRSCFLLKRVYRRLDAWSARSFRRALMELGTGHSITGFVRMMMAVICRPKSAASQVRSRIFGEHTAHCSETKDLLESRRGWL